MLQHLTHVRLVKDARRPPGMHEDHPCQGTLVLRDFSPTYAQLTDAAQPREGGVNDVVTASLYECLGCGHHLPVAQSDDGQVHLRNDFNPSAARWVAPAPLSKDR